MTCCLAVCACFNTGAREVPEDGMNWNILEKFARSEKIPLDSAVVNDPVLDEQVIVGATPLA